jgi:hypothetical protein
MCLTIISSWLTAWFVHRGWSRRRHVGICDPEGTFGKGPGVADIEKPVCASHGKVFEAKADWTVPVKAQ